MPEQILTRFRPRRRLTHSTAVLVPGPLGGLHLYTRRAPGPLRQGPVIDGLETLWAAIWKLPAPRFMILCGARHAGEIADALLGLGDLYVVPTDWLSDIPRDQLRKRANLAARLVATHRRRPIQCMYGAQLPLPF